MDHRLATLKLEAMDVPQDHTILINCVFCGATHEKTLALTKTSDGILYFCHRASCGHKGFAGSSGSFQGTAVPKYTFTPKPFKEATQTCPVWVMDYMKDKYEIDPYDILYNGIKYAPESGCMVFPTKTREGDTWGVLVKDEFKTLPKGSPKAKLYPTKPHPKLHYPFRNYKSRLIIVVEDCISAMKMSKIASTVAILGTHFNDEMALDVLKRAKMVVFALDPDAQNKSIAYAKEYRTIFDTQTLLLDSDPKDYPLVKLKQWYSSVLNVRGH